MGTHEPLGGCLPRLRDAVSAEVLGWIQGGTWDRSAGFSQDKARLMGPNLQGRNPEGHRSVGSSSLNRKIPWGSEEPTADVLIHGLMRAGT